MFELPSRGRCHATFLLAYSARLRNFQDADEWLGAASARSTIMAAASDLRGTADALLACRLAWIDQQVSLDRRLARLSFQADRPTLVAIASLWMRCFPPSWLATAVKGREFFPELVPTSDLEQLAWLEDDLSRIVIDAFATTVGKDEDDLRKALGNAGELAVLAALRHAGFDPVHVALISDAYGYDLEYNDGSALRRVEVKSSTQATSQRIIVSRNEVDKARLHASSWRLVQVVFSSAALINKKATAADLTAIRELSSASLTELTPSEPSHFRWIEAAEFRPPAASWMQSDLSLPSDFEASLA